VASDYVGEMDPARPPIRGGNVAAAENEGILLPLATAVDPPEGNPDACKKFNTQEESPE
jgi:hypothetical protein